MTEQQQEPASAVGQQYYYLGLAAVVVVILIAIWLLFRSPAVENVASPLPAVVETTSEPKMPTMVTNDSVTAEIEDTEPVVEPIVEPFRAEQPKVVDAPPELLVADSKLPALNESDAEVRSSLLDLSWQPGLAGLFMQEDMVRRFVALTDNVSRGQIVPELQVVQPLDRPFAVQSEEPEVYRIDPAGYQRYEPYLTLLESVPVAAQLALLEYYQPLFEEAFNELGYPDTSFIQRLMQAVDYVLEQPVRGGLFLLERPSVMYQFADPDVEAMTDVQKQLIRMGPDNQQRLNQWLQRLKIELKRQPAAN